MHFNTAFLVWLAFLQIYSLAVSDLKLYTHLNILPHRFVPHSPPLTFFSSLLRIILTFDERRAHAVWSPLLCNLPHSPVSSPPLAPTSLSAPYSRTPSAYAVPSPSFTPVQNNSENSSGLRRPKLHVLLGDGVEWGGGIGKNVWFHSSRHYQVLMCPSFIRACKCVC